MYYIQYKLNLKQTPLQSIQVPINFKCPEFTLYDSTMEERLVPMMESKFINQSINPIPYNIYACAQ